MWTKIREYRVQEEFVNVCKSLYEGVEACVREYRVQEEFVNVCKSLYEGVEACVLLGGGCSR